MKIRIAVLGPASSIHLLRWVQNLGPSFEVEIFTLHPAAGLTYPPNIKIINLDRKTKNRADFFLAIPSLNSQLKRFKPDIIHAHYISSYGFMGALSKYKAPIFVSVWGSDLLINQKKIWFKIMSRLLIKKFSWINLAGEHMRKVALDLGVRPDIIHVFQYGIPLDSNARKDLPKHTEKFKILSPRLWEELYNIEVLIEGFIEAQKIIPTLELTICGTSSSEQRRLSIKKLANLSPNITVLGQVNSDRLKHLFKQSHCFISIPSSDGTPLSVLEGIDAGSVPILSNLFANQYWTQDSTLNHLVKALDADSVKNKIVEIYQNYESYDPAPLQKRISQEASYKDNILRLEKAYQQHSFKT